MRRAQGTANGLQNVLVVGLGRFGTSAARTLVGLGHEVMGVDSDAEIVQQAAPSLTAAIQADSTSEEAMRQIGAADFEIAIVAVGHVQDSVLTVAILSDLGVPEIWAKASDARHGKILARIGADHVVYPETQMGRRVANTVSAAVEDYVELEGAYAVATVHPPRDVVDKTLVESKVRTRYGIVVLGVKRGRRFILATPSLTVRSEDMTVVGGPTNKVKRFARSAH